MATDVRTVAVLFALEREATPFRRILSIPACADQTQARMPVPPKSTNIQIHVSGIGRERAQRCVERVLETSTPSLIIAAGFCGALNPTLQVGDIVTSPRILTVDHLVSDPAEKRRLAAHADAVDMESAAIADVCAAKGIEFLAVRAVSDASDTALSPELVHLLSGGNVSMWMACRALLGKPSLLPEFLRLGRDAKLAARNLAAALVKAIGSA